MTISIVIPAYNEEQFIGACLESVLRHKTDDVIEIIVVNNASQDKTAEVAASYPGVKVVHEHRKGTGFARHRGFEEAKGHLIAYIDADSRIHDEWIPMIKDEFAKDPEIVSLSGPFKYYDLPKVQSAMVYAWWMAGALPAYWHKKFAALGANHVVKRDALVQIGGFDTSIPFYGDDTNIARRLHKVGKVKWNTRFFNYSSARRLKAEGFVRAGTKYAINYFTQAYFEKTVTKEYADHRR